MDNLTFLDNSTTIALTPAELWIQLLGFYFLLSILSVIGYTIMSIGILRSKNLRSRFFVILCSLLTARIFVSLQMLTHFVYRSLRTLNIVPTTLPRWACYLTHVGANFTFTLEMVFLLILLIDRMTALIFFRFYRTLTVRQSVITCVIAAVVTTILKLGPSFFGVDFRETVSCVNGYSGNGDTFTSYTQNIDLAIAILIFLLYSILLIYIRCVNPSEDSSQNVSDKLAFKRQMKLLPVVRSLVLMHCAFSFVSKFLMGVANQFSDASVQQRLIAYGGMMLTVDMFVNAVVLFVGNKDVRRASCPCFSGATVAYESSPAKH